MSALAHVWGESNAADAVWAEFAGMAPSALERRVLVNLRAFIDESERRDGTFVLGGHVADIPTWAAFAKEWERMLPQGLRDERGWYFKMSEMAQNSERMSRVPGFYRILEKHVQFSVTVRFNIHDLRRAQQRIWNPDGPINWGFVNNPWMLAFRSLVDLFHATDVRGEIAHLLPRDAVVDFFFDDRAEKKFLREAWDSYIDTRPQDVAKRFGKEPRFADDRDFLPLQAADLWVWWIAKWQSEGNAEQKFNDLDFGYWKPKDQDLPRFDIWYTEDEFVRALMQLLRETHPPTYRILDRKKLIYFPGSPT